MTHISMVDSLDNQDEHDLKYNINQGLVHVLLDL
jgi:hypothetical protein